MEAKVATLATPSTHVDEPPEPVRTAQQLIPGSYERSTQTHRQAGSMGGPSNGSSLIPAGPSSMDEETREERRKEGGGLSRAR